MTGYVEEFRAAIQSAGLIPPDTIEPDGKLRRFASNGKCSDDAGWYVLHDDGIPAGIFGDWRNGLSQTWRADIGRKLTPAEDAAHRAKVETMRREREAETARQRAEAASKAVAIWKAASPASADHPYLLRKRVPPVTTLRELDAVAAATILGYAPKSKGEPLSGRLLVAPVKVGDALSTCELIDEAGRKSAVYGGAKGGGYWSAQPLPNGDGAGLVIMIGEGVATVLSGHEASGNPAIAALSSSNLQEVAKVMRELYPAATLVILADLVKATGEPDGHAIDAALSVGGKLAIPDFGAGRIEGAKDFNDLHQTRGLEAVRHAIANASAPAVPECQPRARSAPAGDPEGHIAYRCVSDIQAKPIRWLWQGRIARGKVSMLAGNPGLGKSQVTVSMAAVVSTGGTWPVDRTPCERGRVIFLSAEDDPADTIRPRLEASGADLSRVFILDAVVEGYRSDGGKVVRAFNLAKDMERLGALLAEIGDVALIVIDPITAYLGEADSHKNAEIRALLSPLSDLASKHGTAMVCVSHLNKSGGGEALLRVTGSMAFVAAARAAFIVAKDKENETRRLFLPLKNNIGNDQTGLAFAVQPAQVTSPAGLIETSRVLWELEAVTVTADEVMTQQGDPEERSATDEAGDWLRDLLAAGSMKASEVQKEARQAGISDKALRRARERMGIKPHKSGFSGGWWWGINGREDAQDAQDAQSQTLGTFVDKGHLRGDAESVELEI